MNAAETTVPEADLLRTVMEAVPVGVVVTDASGEFQLVNPAAQQLLGGVTGTAHGPTSGYSLLQADGTPFPPEQLPLVRALERGEAPENVEMLVRRSNGDEVLMVVSVRPIRSGDGSGGVITGAVATLADATLLRQAEGERQRSKDEFLAMVSHELRTPLNAILGWAHMLKQGALDREMVDKAVETIVRNANTQARLINDLLDMSRIVSGQLRLDVQELELVPVVEAAIETLRPAADAKRIRITRALDPKAEPILGDPTRMQQVVWNLLSNAIKFTPNGGHVEVRLERADVNVRIVVSDDGPGIPPSFLPHVFDRFRQADPASSRPRQAGLGLGLAIVRHLVELHGGAIEVHSEGEGQGSTFSVTVPWWNPRAIEGAAATRKDDDAEPADLKGLRVLLVEDEPDAQELIAYMLSRFNATVRSVSSSDEALKEVATFRPDVLVSDIQMAGGDGYDLIRAVRKLAPDEGGNVPAVALTALARSEDRRSALAAGYQVHVPKPVTPAMLTAVLGFVLRQRTPSPAAP